MILFKSVTRNQYFETSLIQRFANTWGAVLWEIAVDYRMNRLLVELHGPYARLWTPKCEISVQS